MKITDRLLQSFLGDTPFNSRRFTGNASKDLIRFTPSGGTQLQVSEENYGDNPENILFQLRFPTGELLNAAVNWCQPRPDSDSYYGHAAGRLGSAFGSTPSEAKAGAESQRQLELNGMSPFSRIDVSGPKTSGS